MAPLALRVESLGKRYRIGAAVTRPDTLRETLTRAASAPWRNFERLRRMGSAGTAEEGHDTIWALRDVEFELRAGEVLGIVGRNGAGKSTLLKILSRITAPTVGRAEIHGRIGCLLEVGTGFHPELTGRENVFLNGAMLGMDRAYIAHHFDAIVEFAGVERFIDTPVKRYSSGMYLRLAFAVAAHLEPEILVVDEVLAVGDSEFQKKCIGKMGEVAGEGRTVLFVSHNLGAVRALCSRALLLHGGRRLLDGPVEEVLARYVSAGQGEAMGERRWSADERPGDDSARLQSVRVEQPVGKVASRIDMERPFSMEVEYELTRPIGELNIALLVSDSTGTIVLHTTSNLEGRPARVLEPGRYTSTCTIPANALNAGEYTLHVGADEPFIRMLWNVDSAVRFSVETTCTQMGRYLPGSYKGAMSPRIATWRSGRQTLHRDAVDEPRVVTGGST